ncbi:MAG TPA: hypothetical protein VGR13_02650, partial [Actinomycetota bacterium]|nr:hypothetical protein [Actinomycetota bacterium]
GTGNSRKEKSPLPVALAGAGGVVLGWTPEGVVREGSDDVVHAPRTIIAAASTASRRNRTP